MPSLDNAFKVANALGVSIEFLLTGKEIAQFREPIREILCLLNDYPDPIVNKIYGAIYARLEEWDLLKKTKAK